MKKNKTNPPKDEKMVNSGTVEETIENYFSELDRFKNLIKVAEDANSKMDESEKKVDYLLREIHNMLIKADSTSVLVEREGKKFIFVLSGGQVSIQEIITPKELKIKLAVNKLSEKEENTEDDTAENINSDYFRMIGKLLQERRENGM